MDWNTFLKDYGQSMFTLAGVFLGSIITFFISYLNNRFQAKEKDNEREEQRREAKIQLATELLKTDIKTVEDTIGIALDLINTLRAMKSKQFMGLLSTEEFLSEFQLMFKDKQSHFFRWVNAHTTVGVLAYAFGNEFATEYLKFSDLLDNYFTFLLDLSSVDEAIEKDPSNELIKSAGKLHIMLNEKLISIRDT